MGKKVLSAIVFCLIFTVFAGLSPAADPYVLGYISDITGRGKAMFAPEAEGFRVYMDAVNARGGINGHPVKVIFEDDKSDPARANAVSTKLILEDNVLALVGLAFSFTHKPIYRVAKEHNTLVLTSYSCVAEVYDPVKGDCENIFSAGQVYTPVYTTTTWMDLLSAAKLWPKGTTFGSMCYTSPGGRMISESIAKIGAEKYQWELVYHEDIPPGTADISPWAQKIAKANPQLLFCNFAGEVIVPMLSELEKYGYTGAVYLSDAVSDTDLLKAVEGLMKPKENLFQQTYNELPPDIGDKSIPEYAVIQETIKKSGEKIKWTNRHTNGWLCGMIMEAALNKAGWPCDRAALLKAMENLAVETKGLRGGPYKYSPNDHRGTEYGKLMRWDPKQKKLVTAVDWIDWSAREILNIK